MNIPTRGERQRDNIVVKVSQTDKAKIKIESQRQGVTMSSLIKGLLIEHKIIDPINVVIE
jgi:hypothetical protein